MFNCSESIFQVVDDALKSSNEAPRKKSKVVDEKFREAIDALSAYGIIQTSRDSKETRHSNELTDDEMRMLSAKSRDSAVSHAVDELEQELPHLPVSGV